MPTYKLRVEDLNQNFVEEIKAKFGNARIELRIYPKLEIDELLTESNFWHIISLLDWDQQTEESILEPAIIYLSQQETESIYQFQEILASKLFALDKKVYAENLGEDAYRPGHPFSSDYFLYARACVVANGKEYFEEVLKDPKQMPQGYTFEPLLKLAKKAYKRKTGLNFDYHPSMSYETFSNPEGWEETLTDKLL